MEQCTPLETALGAKRPLRLSIVEFGTDFLVYAENTGKNIIFLRRIILHRTFPGGSSMHFYRDDGPLSFVVPGARLEPGSTHLKIRLGKGNAVDAQAQAEYEELPCRAASCFYKV